MPSAAGGGGIRVGILEFDGEGNPPFGRPVGEGLHGRLFVDLSALAPGSLITPSDRFYIRTRQPESLPGEAAWAISIRGSGGREDTLSVAELFRMARPAGVHLLECAGNGPHRRFGLMSAASWGGVPLAELLCRVDAPDDGLVRVTGYDPGIGSGPRSRHTASWIFARHELEAAGGFLATEMNGAPLSADHGRPVRLLVPGWYGCVCIKWVFDIAVVPADAKATDQMREFAGRTQQPGRPVQAREFVAARQDLAALPVRVEQWRVGKRTEFQVTGIAWGGNKTTDSLQIRFGRESGFVPVEHHDHTMNATWTLWSHTWKPEFAGRTTIRLRAGDPSILARRMNAGYYDRTVIVPDLT